MSLRALRRFTARPDPQEPATRKPRVVTFRLDQATWDRMQELVPHTRYKNASSFIREGIDLLLKREDEQLRPAPPASSLESHVWRLRDGFPRSERASRYQSTLCGRRRCAAQQRGAIAAALHRADGALRLLERRAQGLRRGGQNHREEQGERGEGPHGDRSSP